MASSDDGWEDAPLADAGWESAPLAGHPDRDPASDDGWENVPVAAAPAAPVQSAQQSDGWEDVPVNGAPPAPPSPAAPARTTSTADSMSWNPLAPEMDINHGVDPNAQAPALTPDQYNRKVQEQAEVDHFLNTLSTNAGDVLRTTLQAAQIPADIAAGAFARVHDATEKAIEMAGGAPVSFSDVFNAALNPQAIQAMRQRENGSPDFTKNLQAAPTLTDKIRVIGQEVVPQMLADDVLTPEDITQIRKISPAGYENVGVFITKLGMDVAMDPLSYLSIGSEVAPAAKAAEEAPTVDELVANYVARANRPTGLGAETSAGGRALFQVKVPLISKPILTVKGQAVMQAMDEIGATIESKLPIRPIMQGSGLGRFDNALQLSSIEQASIMPKLTQAQTILSSAGPIDESVMRFTGNAAEHGAVADGMGNVTGGGVALSKQQGINLSVEQLEQSRQYQLQLQRLNEMGNQELIKAGGEDLSALSTNVPDPKDYPKIMTALTKQYGDIPRVIVADGDVSYDLTFSGGSGLYDGGRALTQEALDAKNLQQGINDANQMTRRAGLGTTADAAKARNDLSTQAMNAIYEKTYGIREAFNPNSSEVALNNYANKLDVSRKLRLYGFVRDTYGVEASGIQDAIEAAGQKVEYAKAQGIAPDYEDLVMSKMTPQDYKPLSDSTFGTMAPFYDKTGQKMMVEKALYYPSQIADRLDLQFAQPTRGSFMQAMTWWQRQKATNAITNAFRIGPRSVSNLFNAQALGIWPEMFAEMKNGVGRAFGLSAPDAITQLADGIPTVSRTMFDIDDTTKGLQISQKMLSDPEVNSGVQAFYDALHGAAKDGNVDKSLFGQNARQVLSKFSPKNVVEAINDNPISRTIRQFGSSSDGLVRRAYFRSLINDGFEADQAASMVGNKLGDFGTQNPFVNKNITPFDMFAGFQLKNMETLPALLAVKPSMLNVINPYDGYLRKAIEQYNGWDPKSTQALQQFYPFYRHPIMGAILRGNQALAQGQDKFQDFLNDYVSWGLPPGAKDKLGAGLQMSLQIPNRLETALDTMDLTRANETFNSPLVTAASIGLFGHDPFTGKPYVPSGAVPTDGTPLSPTDRLVGLLHSMNPVDYPKVMNGVVMPVMRRLIPGFQQTLENGPITKRLAQVLSIELGSDAPLKQMKISDEAIRSLTQAKFAGMARLDQPDHTYQMQQMGLFRVLGDMANKLAERKYTQEGRAELQRVVGNLKDVAGQINMNAKIYGDYKARANAIGAHMDPDTQAVLNMQMKTLSDLSPPDDDKEDDDDDSAVDLNGNKLSDQPSRDPQSDGPAEPLPQYVPSAVRDRGTGDPLIRSLQPTMQAVQPLYQKAAQDARDHAEPGLQDVERRLLQLHPDKVDQVRQFMDKKRKDINDSIDQEMQIYLDRSPDQFQKPGAKANERLPASQK